MVMVKGGEGYWLWMMVGLFWWRLPGIKGCLFLFLCFPCLRDEKIDRNLGKFPNFFIVLCGRLLIGWKKGSRCLWIFLVNALCLCRLVNTPLCSLLSVPFTGRKCWNLNDSWRFD